MKMKQNSSTTITAGIVASITISAGVLALVYLRLKTGSDNDASGASNENVLQQQEARNLTSDDTLHKITDPEEGTYDDLERFLPPHVLRKELKIKKRLEKMKRLAMKSPMYDNTQMVDSKGELLCMISGKKGRWYVAKDLADWTDASQTCIKLRFEPNARSNRVKNGIYAKSDKQNVCVACGAANHHIRHYIVPQAYRTLLPNRFKSHLSHDIVILCINCHVRCSQQCQRRMQKIEEEYRVRESTQAFEVNHDLFKMRSCALAMLKWKDKLPAEKSRFYESIVRDHLSLREDINLNTNLTTDQLQRAINVEYKVANPDYVSGPELVASALGDNEEKILEFVRDWRHHFLETVHPQFMPLGWDVHYEKKQLE